MPYKLYSKFGTQASVSPGQQMQKRADAIRKMAQNPDNKLLIAQFILTVIIGAVVLANSDTGVGEVMTMMGFLILQMIMIYSIKLYIKMNFSNAGIISKMTLLGSVLMVLLYGLYYMLLDSWAPPKNKKTHFSGAGGEGGITFGDAMYFAFVTGSTVGYGDILPTTNASKFLVLNQIVSQVLFAADMLAPIVMSN